MFLLTKKLMCLSGLPMSTWSLMSVMLVLQLVLPSWTEILVLIRIEVGLQTVRFLLVPK